MSFGGDSEDAARRRAAETAPDVSRETLEALDAFAELTRRWTKKINLVSRGDVSKLWERHILDSLGLAPMLSEARRWTDLGSGGGFPALPLAIVAKGAGREIAFDLYESDRRKAAFLNEATRLFDLPVAVHIQRIEAADPASADTVSARALASVAELLPLAKKFLGNTGVLALLKGPGAHGELTEAARCWHMRYQAERHPLTLKGYILRLQGISRADDR